MARSSFGLGPGKAAPNFLPKPPPAGLPSLDYQEGGIEGRAGDEVPIINEQSLVRVRMTARGESRLADYAGPRS